jgi:hypothetical protein
MIGLWAREAESHYSHNLTLSPYLNFEHIKIYDAKFTDNFCHYEQVFFPPLPIIVPPTAPHSLTVLSLSPTLYILYADSVVK